MAPAPLLPTDTPDPASIPVLVRSLLDDGELLFRSELRLAQAQFGSRARAAIVPLIALLLGSLLVLTSLFTALAAVIGWLTPRLGAGNAALVVTLCTATIGFACMAMGYRRLTAQTRIVLPPSEEVKS